MKKHTPKFVLALILIASSLLMIGTAYDDSPVKGEIKNISAGYEKSPVWEKFTQADYSILYSLAAAPLKLLAPDISPAENPEKIIFYARLAPIFIALLLILFVYVWAREMLGNTWALVPAGLTALSPTIIGYGHYVLDDVAVSFGFLLFSYCVIRAARSASIKNASFLLISSAAFAAFSPKSFLTIAIISAGLAVFMLAKQQLRHNKYFRKKAPTKFSMLFAGLGIIAGALITALGKIDMVAFAEALTFGGWRNLAIHYLLKEPLPFLILFAVGLTFALFNITRAVRKGRPKLSEFIMTNQDESVMLVLTVAAIIYATGNPASSMPTLLPILPFIYILVASAIKNMTKGPLYKSAYKVTLLAIAANWHIASIFMAYPIYGYYFNEVVFGSKSLEYDIGHAYDLGADLKRLNSWALENVGEEGKIGLDYYPLLSETDDGIDPHMYLGTKYVQWKSSYNEPEEVKLSYLAVSIRKIYEAKRTLGADETRNRENEYVWLKNIYEPYQKIGSIFIYKLK